MMTLTPKTEVIENFKHYPGRHCAVSSWTGLMNHLGFDYTQTEIFGMGCGFNFIYSVVPSTKDFNIIITSDTVEVDFLSNIGMHAESINMRNNDQAFDQIIDCLQNKIPIAVRTNPMYSPNIVANTPPEYHDYVSQHWIILVGYDNDTREFIHYDSTTLKKARMSFDKFKESRNTGIYDQNPQNHFIKIKYPAECYPKEISMLLSLRKVSYKFLHVKKPEDLSLFYGKYGFEKAIRHMALWPKMMDDEKLLDTLYSLKIALSMSRAVKGAFRFVFSDYLLLCEDSLGLDKLSEVARKFKISGHLWKDFVAMIDEVVQDVRNPKYWGNDSMMANLLNEIFVLENEGHLMLESELKTISPKAFL